MQSMFDDDTRRLFIGRIGRLRPDATRQFGKMNVHQMVCHLAAQLRITLGDIPAKPVPGPLRFPPIKYLVIDVLPWPKGRIKGPPEAFLTPVIEWDRDISELKQLLERFAESRTHESWADHPMFGTMSGPLWARLTSRHFDHHLKQFGV